MASTVKSAAGDARPPSDAEMAAVLGDAYPAFQALVNRDGKATAEWRRYTKRSPWVLKVSEGKRTLFYARPESGSLTVTVLLGGRAVDAALAGQVSKRLHASIRKAKAYPEGRILRRSRNWSPSSSQQPRDRAERNPDFPVRTPTLGADRKSTLAITYLRPYDIRHTHFRN